MKNWIPVLSLGGATLLGVALVMPVACTSQSESPNSAPEEVGGAGVEVSCESDRDCARETPVCNGAQGCVECEVDTDCEPGRSCVDYACGEPIACSSSEDCEGSDFPACDTAQGFCLGCVQDEDCEDSERCGLSSTCVSVTNCVNSADCEEGSSCDRDRGFCVDCNSDLDCAEGQVCSRSECVSVCASNEDCSESSVGQFCNSALGQCAECLADADCGESFFCELGECTRDTCVPEESYCTAENNGLMECLPNGKAHSKLLCPTGTTCEDGLSAASCETWICSPYETSCDAAGNVLSTCDGTGLSIAASTDCRDSGGRCETSACVEAVCDAGKTFCSLGDSYQCNALGTAFTFATTCSAFEYCDEPSGTCVPNVCEPSTKVCSDDVSRTCNSLGSGFLDADVDCSDTGDVCVDGLCKEVICDWESRCNGEEVETCDEQGTVIGSSECSYGYHCKENGDQASCSLDVCEESTTECQGKVWGECAANGSGYISSEDCALSQESCLSGIGCMATAGLGSTASTYNYDQYLWLNSYSPTETVVLSKFKQYADTASGVTLTFAVFEADTALGSYTLKSSLTQSAAWSSVYWHESPVMNVELTAGKYYLVGIQVPNSDYVYHGAIETVSTSGPLTTLGAVRISDPTPLDSPRVVSELLYTTSAYHQQLVFN